MKRKIGKIAAAIVVAAMVAVLVCRAKGQRNKI